MRRYALLAPMQVWSVMDGTACGAHAQLASVVGRVSLHHLTA
jgi:hypothetical protein